MATIRVRDWTKARIEEIQAAESHSSHDSVIKTLLKDRQLAVYAGPEPGEPAEAAPGSEPSLAEKAFDDLTVFAELRRAENGVLFLWCPSCGNEIAHLAVENPVSIPVFEVECQRCLAHLDQHAIVAIEIGYPLEQQLVEGTVAEDLQDCVIDYWDRTLAALDTGADPINGTDADRLVWQIGQYLDQFNWDWPPGVPAVAVQPGETYRDESTGERFAVRDRVTDGPSRGYLIDWLDDADTDTEQVTDRSMTDRLLGRNVYLDTD